MKKVRKKRKTVKDNMKLSDLIKNNAENFTEFDKFDEKLKEFQEKYCNDLVKIAFFPYLVKVILPNKVDWTRENHLQLCEDFGLKLAKYCLVYEADRVCVTWTYAADCDENVQVLDFNKIM